MTDLKPQPHIYPWTPMYTTQSVAPGRCRAAVFFRGEFSSHQCSGKATVVDALGYGWCGKHSPEAYAKRDAKRESKYLDEKRKRDAVWDKRRAAQQIADAVADGQPITEAMIEAYKAVRQ